MNTRIQELAEQAITEKLSLEEFIEALKKEPNDFYGFRVSELQKYTELIVQECACIADDMKSLDVAEAIKQHFGLEP